MLFISINPWLVNTLQDKVQKVICVGINFIFLLLSLLLFFNQQEFLYTDLEGDSSTKIVKILFSKKFVGKMKIFFKFLAFILKLSVLIQEILMHGFSFPMIMIQLVMLGHQTMITVQIRGGMEYMKPMIIQEEIQIVVSLG